MNGLPQSSADNGFWEAVLEQVARRVAPGHFDTWFRPVRFAALRNNGLHLVVPNDVFRQAFLQHCSAILRQAATQVTGSLITLVLSVEHPPENEPDPAASLPVVRAAELESRDHRPLWLVERLWTSQASG